MQLEHFIHNVENVTRINYAWRIIPHNKIVSRGGSRIFSRGGGGADFQKIFQNFDDLFILRATKLIFRALPKHCFAPILAKFSALEANF